MSGVSLSSQLLWDDAHQYRDLSKEKASYQKIIDHCREKLNNPSLDSSTREKCKALMHKNLKLLKTCNDKKKETPSEVINKAKQQESIEKNRDHVKSLLDSIDRLPSAVNALSSALSSMADNMNKAFSLLSEEETDLSQ